MQLITRDTENLFPILSLQGRVARN